MKLFELLFTNLFLLVLFLGVSALIGAFAWPYAINEWLVLAGRNPSVTWWHGAIIGAVPGLGLVCIPLSIITWIAMLFLG